jgi:hypothetical protein
MRIVFDFKSPFANDLTIWTKIKLSYLVVSAHRYDRTSKYSQTAFIWATNT